VLDFLNALWLAGFSFRIKCDFDHIRVRGFVLTGAPLSARLRTPRLLVLTRKGRLLKHVLAAPDPDLPVVNLNAFDEGLQVGLPKRYRAGAEVLPHHPAETLDQGRVDLDLRSRMLLGAFQGSLCPVTFRLQGGQPVLEHAIQVRQPVLNQPSGHGAAGIEANICLRVYESTPQVRPKK
jgi:hypothetical protein